MEFHETSANMTFFSDKKNASLNGEFPTKSRESYRRKSYFLSDLSDEYIFFYRLKSSA